MTKGRGKILYLSDLHIASEKRLEEFKNFIAPILDENVLSAIVLGGDIAEQYESFQLLDSILNLLSPYSRLNIFIPGNHCVYSYKHTFHDLILNHFPNICQSNGFRYYRDGIFGLTNSLGGVNTLLHCLPNWFDSKFPSAPYPLNKEQIESLFRQRITDAHMIKDLGDITDFYREDFELFSSRSNSSLYSLMLKDVNRVSNTHVHILFTHYPVYWNFKITGPSGKSEPSNMFFIGSKAVNDFSLEFRFNLTISGHIHHKFYATLGPNQHYVISGSDYNRFQAIIIDLDKYVESMDRNPITFITEVKSAK